MNTLSKRFLLIWFILCAIVLAWCSKEEFFQKTEDIGQQLLSWKQSLQKQVDCISYKKNLQKTIDEQAQIILETWTTYSQKINDIFFSLSQNVCFAIIKETKIYSWWKEEYYKLVNLATNKAIKYDLKNKINNGLNLFQQKLKELKWQ